jgi:lysyl-tRNA synthetase class 2
MPDRPSGKAEGSRTGRGGDELFEVRCEKLARLRSMGIDPYPSRYHRTHTTQEGITLLREAEVAQGNNNPRTAEISVAGRLSAIRLMGRASFADLRDGSGRLQLYLRRDILGEENYQLLRELDLGDFVGAQGPLFRTRTGEPSLEAHNVTILTKSLRPPPEKWHGLRDVEQRYRQRELDLIANEEVRQRFLNRSHIVGAVRSFLNRRGFVEVETPVLLSVAAGAMARPFVTHHNTLGRTLYLRIATELYLKRCIIGGLDKVFEIGRIFRNEGIDATHNPEFTTLESYEAYANYEDVMQMVEEMVHTVAQDLLSTSQLEWRGHAIDLTPPWQRLSLREELWERCGVDLEKYTDVASLTKKMRQLGVRVGKRASWGRLVDKLISEVVEPHLIQPVFLMDYPREMSPLAKSKPGTPGYVERFEGFVGGMELANAFTELNDPLEQRHRFIAQEEMHRLHGDEEFDRLDEEFLNALEYGMPPTGGLGVGIDRLVMLLTGQTSIREVTLFPHLSLTQEEILRQVDRSLEASFEHASNLSTNENTIQEITERLRHHIPQEFLSRITPSQLQGRIQRHLDRLRDQ